MSRIGLIGENSMEYIDKLLDIWNSGKCAVLIDWRIPFQTAVEMMKEASVQQCYIEKKILEKGHDKGQNNILFIPFENKNNTAKLLPDEIYDKFKENYSKNEAIILYSSGTTGKAKGIILSHYAINKNADAIINYMQPTKDDCIYIAKMLSHSSTLTGELLVALKKRMNLVIASTIVPPRYVLNNIEKFAITIICVNPTLLLMYANEYSRVSYNISSLRIIYVSGSILNDKIYNYTHEIFKGITIYNVYGLTEASPRVTAQRADCCKTNSVGKPIDEINIVIVDEKGNIVEQGKFGIIHVNTPSRFNGYISGNEKHISIYQGWLNTGDIGYIDENDEVHIVNRIDDVIFIDSHKIYPSEIENVVNQHPLVSESAVKDFGEGFMDCEFVSETDNIEISLQKWCLERLAIYEVPRRFVKVEKIKNDNKGNY